MTADIRDQSVLPPPQPPDPPDTRPPLDLPHVVRQIQGIQQFLAQETAKKKEAEQK